MDRGRAHWCVTVAMPVELVVAVAVVPSPKLNVSVAPLIVCVESSSNSALNVNVCCVLAAVGVLFVNITLASPTFSLRRGARPAASARRPTKPSAQGGRARAGAAHWEACSAARRLAKAAKGRHAGSW